MRYSALVHVRRHAADRWTVALVDPDARDLAAHAPSRRAAEEQVREAVAARIEDPDDRLGDRLREPFELRPLRQTVAVRVRRGSGRHRELALPVAGGLVLQPGRLPEIAVPRLGLRFDVPPADDATVALADEVRRELSGATEAEVLGHAAEAEEEVALLDVFARPRERVRRRRGSAAEPPGILAAIGRDLLAEVRRGRGAAAYEREAEVARVLEALASSPPASVLLTGPSGVGKTAIVHEVARRIALGEAPAALAKARVYALPGSRLIAGMRYFGDWEERCREVVEEARARQAILFVDDLVELCEAGRSDESDAGVARFFAPHVQRGEVALVAESTPERLARVERMDASLLPLFRAVTVEELSGVRTLEVLRRLQGPLGRRHGVSFDERALETALDLTRRFVPGKRLPGKAAGFLARAAEALADTRGAPSREPDAVDAATVTAAFAQETGLPEVVLRDDLPLERDRLVADLEARVVEQPEAARALADAVLLVKTGLNDPKKPAAVYLFVGPTGTGKTESARVLAERLFGDPGRLLRFDMSELQDPAGVARLLGSESREGELPRRVREQPFAVVLLDEIEKAHESVFDGLLSVLGEGRLVDRGGRAADFRSAIVVLTSNLGATDGDAVGFGKLDAPTIGRRFTRAVEAFFRPELLNRIDRIVPFGPLSPAAIEKIARRELSLVAEREGLVRRRVSLRFSEDLVESLARAGYHPTQGARPLKRELERRILVPLAEHLLRKGERGPGEIELYVDATGEVRLAARGREPRRTEADEFFDLESPATLARMRAGLSRLGARLAEARDLGCLRSIERSLAAAHDDRLRQLRGRLRSLEGELERSAVRGLLESEALGEALARLDGELTLAELALLVIARPAPPVERLSVVEERAGGVPGAAAAWVAERLASGARAMGLHVVLQTGAGECLLTFADPVAAGVLGVESGWHEFEHDFASPGERGARVRVGHGAEEVRRLGGLPVPYAQDLRTGLRLPGLGSKDLVRFVLAAWRRSS